MRTYWFANIYILLESEDFKAEYASQKIYLCFAILKNIGIYQCFIMTLKLTWFPIWSLFPRCILDVFFSQTWTNSTLHLFNWSYFFAPPLPVPLFFYIAQHFWKGWITSRSENTISPGISSNWSKYLRGKRWPKVSLIVFFSTLYQMYFDLESSTE